MKGCLFIHGFTGSPEEVNPLAQYLAQETDWYIHVPILPGHAQDQSLRGVSWKEWLAFAEAEYQRMSKEVENVHVIGFSMGGLIASYLAAKNQVDRLVLLSPAVYQFNTQQIMKDMRQMLQAEEKDSTLIKIIERYKQKIASTPLTAVFQYKKLVKEVMPLLTQIEAPVLLMHGEEDELIHPKSSHYIYNCVKSREKELILLKSSRHLICHDSDREQVLNAVTRFLMN